MLTGGLGKARDAVFQLVNMHQRFLPSSSSLDKLKGWIMTVSPLWIMRRTTEPACQCSGKVSNHWLWWTLACTCMSVEELCVWNANPMLRWRQLHILLRRDSTSHMIFDIPVNGATQCLPTLLTEVMLRHWREFVIDRALFTWLCRAHLLYVVLYAYLNIYQIKVG